jgi:hypothetical protein
LVGVKVKVGEIVTVVVGAAGCASAPQAVSRNKIIVAIKTDRMGGSILYFT